MRTERLCDLCLAEPADPNFVEVVGWARNRRGEGGTNHVRARRETGRRIGRNCLRRLERGELADEQELPLAAYG